MSDPSSVPSSINFAGSLLYDDKSNFVAIPSGSVLNVTQSYIPIVAQVDNGTAAPLSLTSGSLALKVSQISPRPISGEYSVGLTLINGSASAQNLFSIENPVASGKFVIVRKMGVGGTVAAVTTALFVYRMGRNNVFPTGGTPITATKRSSSISAPVAIVRSAPAGSVTNNMWTSSPGTYVTAVGHMAATTYMAIDSLDDEGDILLAPGEALIMIADSNDTDWRHYGFVRWQEST